MPNIQAITRERHANQRWRRYNSYSFAAADALSPLVVQEMPKATLSLPIGFIAAEGGYQPVAIQGLKPGKNLFVAADGRWVGSYVPAAYRGYPFALARAGDGKQVLCIDEGSGLLSASDGEPFFGEDGQPGKAVTDVLKFLNQIDGNRQVTRHICALLQKHNLIQPWKIVLQGEDGEQKVEGLYRIDEAAMNRLPAEAFMELRDAGALLLAYCQLLSMLHLPMLGQLAAAHAKAATPPPAQGLDLESLFMAGGDTLKFDGIL